MILQFVHKLTPENFRLQHKVSQASRCPCQPPGCDVCRAFFPLGDSLTSWPVPEYLGEAQNNAVPAPDSLFGTALSCDRNSQVRRSLPVLDEVDTLDLHGWGLPQQLQYG